MRDEGQWKQVALQAIAERDELKRALDQTEGTKTLYRRWRYLRGRVKHILDELDLAAKDLNPERRGRREAALHGQLRRVWAGQD